MHLIPDTIDISSYLGRSEDFTARVRSGCDYAEGLIESFRQREAGAQQPEMFSTKLRGRLYFRPGEVTAWAGYNGHRKSMFTGQVTLDLCVQRERVLVISLEMLPVQTLGRMARQAFAVARPADASLDRFARWTDGRLWMFDHHGRIKPETCIALCRFFADQHQGTHVVIDSMMMVCASEEHLDEQKQFMTDAVRVAQETGLHLHIVAHCRKPASGDEAKPPTKYDLRGSAAITDQAHNVVTIWANRDKEAKLRKNPNDDSALQEPDAFVTVEKQRNDEFEGRLKLWFDRRALRFTDERHTVTEPYVLNP
jgi:twinkle protein